MRRPGIRRYSALFVAKIDFDARRRQDFGYQKRSRGGVGFRARAINYNVGIAQGIGASIQSVLLDDDPLLSVEPASQTDVQIAHNKPVGQRRNGAS